MTTGEHRKKLSFPYASVRVLPTRLLKYCNSQSGAPRGDGVLAPRRNFLLMRKRKTGERVWRDLRTDSDLFPTFFLPRLAFFSCLCSISLCLRIFLLLYTQWKQETKGKSKERAMGKTYIQSGGQPLHLPMSKGKENGRGKPSRFFCSPALHLHGRHKEKVEHNDCKRREVTIGEVCRSSPLFCVPSASPCVFFLTLVFCVDLCGIVGFRKVWQGQKASGIGVNPIRSFRQSSHA